MASPGDGEEMLDQEELAAAQKCGYTWDEAIAFKGVYRHYDNNFGKGDGKCSIQLVGQCQWLMENKLKENI